MTSSTTSSIYGTSVSGKGIGGLMSGLDTEGLVEQMLQATQAKINRQYQSQQKLAYKQEAYREVISKFVSFSDKYLSYSSKTNIFSSNFFKSTDFSSSNSSINVSGDSTAIKNFMINKVNSVATNSRFTSTQRVSDTVFESGKIEASKDVSTLASQSMTIKYGSNSYTLTIGENLDPYANLDTVVSDLNNQVSKVDALKNADGSYKIEFINDGGTIGIKNNGTGDMKITALGKGIEEGLKLKVSPSEGGSTGAGEILKAEEAAATTFYKTENLSDILKAGQITFDYNSTKKTIRFTDTNITNATDLKTYLQGELDKAYGTGKVTVSTTAEGGISFDAGGGNNLFGISSIDKDVSRHLGLTSSTYNRINKNKSIAEAGLNQTVNKSSDNKYKISVNDKIFEFDEGATINDIINKINNDTDAGVRITHSSTTDTFTVVSDDTGAHTTVNIKDVDGGNLASVLFGKAGTQAEVDSKQADYVITNGTDAKLEVTMNGSTSVIERSTNTFTFDGINIELSNASLNAENVTFNVSNNTDSVVENMAKFINDYNEIVSYLDNKIMETPNRSYAPLTDAQKKEMSESEIKAWEEKAKAGMLYSDRTMYSALYDLRSSMQDAVKGAGILIQDIGITTLAGDYSGKLVFDETKFREAYANNSEAIEKLFTQSVENGTKDEQGIAYKLKSAIEKNVGTRGEKGLLVDFSGTKNTSTEKVNYLSERMDEYQETIDKLKVKMEAERKKYWSQFTALEKALASMNSQSSWLSSQFQ